MKYFDYSTRLVSMTEPLIDDVNTSEELVAFCARVSNPTNPTSGS